MKLLGEESLNHVKHKGSDYKRIIIKESNIKR